MITIHMQILVNLDTSARDTRENRFIDIYFFFPFCIITLIRPLIGMACNGSNNKLYHNCMSSQIWEINALFLCGSIKSVPFIQMCKQRWACTENKKKNNCNWFVDCRHRHHRRRRCHFIHTIWFFCKNVASFYFFQCLCFEAIVNIIKWLHRSNLFSFPFFSTYPLFRMRWIFEVNRKYDR